MAISSAPPSAPPPAISDLESPPPADPPPPYPSRERRTGHSRAHRGNRLHIHGQTASGDSTLYPDDPLLSQYTDEDADIIAAENVPFLAPHASYGVTSHGRSRSQSHASTISGASLTHAVMTLFQAEDEVETFDHGASHETGVAQRHGARFLSLADWKHYFRPMVTIAYHKALFHLLMLNFPYGLIAWVYLFVFTVSGTTLLVALPLGAVLCFFDLIGARAFSRGELALQTRFHSPLAHPPPYPPRPIFTRYREPTTAEIESGQQIRLSRNGLLREKSFYKNAYALFTDPTSYQALFYFLVVKPAITLLIVLGILVIGIPCFILILPAPAMLRAVRKIGRWQANIAVEGLYFAVR